MAAWKSELHNVDSVMNFYEQHEAPMFRIYAGNKPEPAYCRFEYYGDNKQDGAGVLYENLQALKINAANTNQYLLQVIAKLKSTNTKVKPTEFFNVTFQLNGNEIQAVGNVSGFYNNSEMLLNKLIESNEKNNMLLQSLIQKNLIDQDDEEEDEPEEENILNGVLKNPDMQNLLIAGLTKLLTPKSGNIAGMEQHDFDKETALNTAIERLRAVDPNLHNNLSKLADIAEKDKATFNYLISMLNKM